MWVFDGKYTGEAKAYLKAKEKKKMKITLLIFSIIVAIIYIGMGIYFESFLIAFFGWLGTMLFLLFALFLVYKREPKCRVEIKNDGFSVYGENGNWSTAFYKMGKIEEYEEFILLELPPNGEILLQKDLLIEGDLEELKALLKKVEESLDTDNPMYQIDAPTTEFFEATVKGKRIYEKFVNGVSWAVPVG